MMPIHIGLSVGMGVFLIGSAYLWKLTRVMDVNLNALLKGVAGRLVFESASDKIKEFDDVKKEVIDAQSGRKRRFVRVILGLAVLSTMLGLAVFFLSSAFIGLADPSLFTLLASILFSAAFLYFFHLLESSKHCVIKADSASSALTWLGLILPSISAKGKMHLVQGSMNPCLLGQKWFFNALVWLKEEKGVDVRIVSGSPKFEEMNKSQFERWQKYRDNILQYGFQDRVRITSERPEKQFALTNKVVQLESKHPDWVTREKKMKGDILVPNHLHICDPFLIWRYESKFERLWAHARPAEEQTLSEKFRSNTNHGDTKHADGR